MAAGEEAAGTSIGEETSGRLKRMWQGVSIVFASKTATIGLIIVLFWLFVAVFAPFLTPEDGGARDQSQPDSHN